MFLLKTYVLIVPKQILTGWEGVKYMKRIVAEGALLTLEIQAYTLLMSFLLPLLYVPIRMLVSDSLIQDVVFGVIALMVETVVVFFHFKRIKLNNRNKPMREMLLPMSLAYTLHFFISLINGFYLYTAGSGVATLGRAAWCIKTGEYTNEHATVPTYPFLLFFACKLIVLFLFSILGYYSGKKKLEKERAAIIGN